MQSDKKEWAKPGVIALDRSVFRTWHREKLLRARELILEGLNVVEARGDIPEAAANLRIVLDELDAEIAE